MLELTGASIKEGKNLPVPLLCSVIQIPGPAVLLLLHPEFWLCGKDCLGRFCIASLSKSEVAFPHHLSWSMSGKQASKLVPVTGH